ncbi:restriction endonuclease subunit S [Mediterranea massiliensis]|uniref:restriction endonuclease subunit S n=1 Tax=Mediterranea massiliensis TaxID=1841865 RepID=UPI00320A3A0B
MEEWKEYKIADICNIKHGFAFKGQYFTETEQNYICVTPGNFGIKGGFKLDKPKYYYGPIPKDYILHADDLIVTMTDLSKDGDTLGYSALIPQNSNCIFLHNQRIGLIEKISPEIDKHFLYWIMRTYNYQKYIVNHCSGSTVKHTSPTNIGSYVFKAPSLEKQKNLVSFLDNIETKIELNRRINENLEQQAQALFKSWFVDFEPFKDGKFVDSELGRIPEGWRVGVFNELVEILSGFAFKSNTFVEKGKYQLITIKAVQDGLLNISGSNYINIIPPKMPQYCFLRKGDILLSLTGNVGRTCIVTYDNLLLNQRVAKIKPKNIINRMFLYIILRQLDFKKRLIYLAKGTAQLNLSPIETGQIKIIIPSEEYLKKYADMMNSKFDMMLNNSIENIALSELRDTLLPRLMSGELAITDVDDRSIFQ